MKLKCDEHGRRVVAVDGLFIHRTGDGSKCSSPKAKIGKKTMFAKRLGSPSTIDININFDAKLFEQQVQKSMDQITAAFNQMVLDALPTAKSLKHLARQFKTHPTTKIEEL